MTCRRPIQLPSSLLANGASILVGSSYRLGHAGVLKCWCSGVLATSWQAGVLVLVLELVLVLVLVYWCSAVLIDYDVLKS